MRGLDFTLFVERSFGRLPENCFGLIHPKIISPQLPGGAWKIEVRVGSVRGVTKYILVTL